MNRSALAASTLLVSLAATAQDHAIYSDGFDPPVIAAQFERSGDAYLLPTDPAAGPAAMQARWLLSELVAGQTTSAAEVSAHSTTNDPQGLANFIAAIRNDYPDARIVDLISLTPNFAEFVIKGSGAIQEPYYILLLAQYTGAKKMSYFATMNLPGGTAIQPGDANLNLVQAVSNLYAMAPAGSVLVAKIDANDQCVPVSQADANTPRSTASIIKNWVLFGLGRMIVDGDVHADDTVPLDPDLFAAGGNLNSETLNTPIPLLDLAKMMMALSDNTATELIENRVGRSRLDAAVDASGYLGPEAIKPFLSMSENFHLAFSFPSATADAYMNGSEGYQQAFLASDIVPLGNFGDASPRPYFNPGIFSQGGWRATATDVCNVLARLRRLPQGSEAMQTVDAALSSSAWLPDVRPHWDRVWYKEGQFFDGNGGNYVFNNMWLVENAGDPPYVLVSLLNDDAAGISDAVDFNKVNSLNARILQILATQQP